MVDNVFNQDGKPIKGFTATCDKCGSHHVIVDYEFNYYGGATGWDTSLSIKCGNCDNKTDLKA